MILGQIFDLYIKIDGKKFYCVVDIVEVLCCCVWQVNVLKQKLDVLVIIGDLVDFGKFFEYVCLCDLLVLLIMLYYLLLGNYDECNVLCVVFLEYIYLQQGGECIEYVIEDYVVCIIVFDIVILCVSGGELVVFSLLWLDEVLVQQLEWLIVIVMYYLFFIIGIGYMDDMGLVDLQVLEVVVCKYLQVECILCGYLYCFIQWCFGGMLVMICLGVLYQVQLDVDL